MKGWLGKYQDMGVTIYLTPDGKHAISGYMYDENGNNLSEQLFQKSSTRRQDRRCGRRWPAPTGCRMAIRTPPSCCMSLPIPSAPTVNSSGSSPAPVEAGKVQIRTLLVGVIKPESPATAAAILATRDRRRPGMIMSNRMEKWP